MDYRTPCPPPQMPPPGGLERLFSVPGQALIAACGARGRGVRRLASAALMCGLLFTMILWLPAIVIGDLGAYALEERRRRRYLESLRRYRVGLPQYTAHCPWCLRDTPVRIDGTPSCSCFGP